MKNLVGGDVFYASVRTNQNEAIIRLRLGIISNLRAKRYIGFY